jgi:hypothetical protein
MLQCQWRCVRSKNNNAVLYHSVHGASRIYLSKFRVAVQLQRRWRNTVRCTVTFHNELDSLRFLHNIVVGIQRVIKDHIISLMELSLSWCQGRSVNCCKMYEEVSLSCVKETRIVRNILTISVAKAVENLPFPLDEDIATILDDYLVIVKSSFECFITALLNIHGHSIEEMIRIFHLAYFDASGNHDLMTVVINNLSCIIKTFK